MTNDKKFTIVEQLKAQLNIPKTETRIILEQEDLYPDLEYSDISSSKGYGPMMSHHGAGFRSMINATIAKKLEEEREERERKRE